MFACYKIVKSKTSFDRGFLFINSLWIIFILMDGISILSQNINRQDLRNKYAVNIPKSTSAVSLPMDSGTTQSSIQPSSKQTDSTSALNLDSPVMLSSKQPSSGNPAAYIQPDIYYIIFDSYSASTILNKMGYNNTAIEDSLINKGFKIVENSTSNYNLTSFSIASTLSIKYIDVDTMNKYHLDDYLPAANVIKYNGLVPWLEAKDYAINNFSFFDIDEHPALIPSGGFWDIDDIYLQHNAGLKIYKDLSWNFKLPSLVNARKIQRAVDKRDAYDDSVYTSLLSISKKTETGPRFVYAHFFMPHIPNSHDTDGTKIPVNTELTVEEEMLGYFREIKFVNKRINTIATTILQHSKRPLVIIFQGDHGYRFYDDNKKADEFPNFCAVYFSNRDYSHVPYSLSNVNLFKAVMNTWFNQQIPFDQNSHFSSNTSEVLL